MGWRGPMTHRQYLAWRAWQDTEWNRPSRTDWYLMALRAEVLRYTHWRAGMTAEEIKLANMKLVLASSAPESDADREQLLDHQMAVSKQAALARIGRPVREVPMPSTPGGSGAEDQPDFTWDGPTTELPSFGDVDDGGQ